MRQPGDPRSRGERDDVTGRDCALAGRPPLARGKGRLRHAAQQHQRETPARAGKGSPVPASPSPPPGDPRSRGERGVLGASHATVVGRPPLARGKGCTEGSRRVTARETPARAGKGDKFQAHQGNPAGDPRSRGERAVQPATGAGASGRPPLARGKGTLSVGNVVAVRETPARAGKGSAKHSRALSSAGDPRSRGERAARASQGQRAVGRPPLARGKVWPEIIDIAKEYTAPANYENVIYGINEQGTAVELIA